MSLSSYYAMWSLFISPFFSEDQDDKRGIKLISRKQVFVLYFLALSIGCSSPPAQLPSPGERLNTAREHMEKHHYELALKSLEELKPVTMGTKLGGEVQFLLAENKSLQGKHAEAEVDYRAYLTLYPEGPFSEKALFMTAFSKVKQIKKTSIGFFTLRSYIPHDRDISTLVEAGSLFEQYLDRYPSGEWKNQAEEMADELRKKEGEHLLEIISFYLKKKQPKAALARTQQLLKGDYPDPIMTRARELAVRAGKLLSAEVDAGSP